MQNTSKKKLGIIGGLGPAASVFFYNRITEHTVASCDQEHLDIILLSQSIDEVTDKIEDVLIRIYINNVQQIRPEALAFIKVIIRCCEALKEVMEEFADFRKSKTLHGLIIEINALEEEGDRLFIESMRRLHAEVTDPIEIIAWREIYVYLEKCCDACEHVADVVESVIMKNT